MVPRKRVPSGMLTQVCFKSLHIKWGVGINERALVLVRPDGHVAWRADEVPPDAGEVIDKVRGIAA